jgi:hypothetical protein
MEMPSPKELSLTDRERILWTASGQYMRGEISSEQLEEIERRYDPSLIKAVLTLAKRHRKHRPDG